MSAQQQQRRTIACGVKRSDGSRVEFYAERTHAEQRAKRFGVRAVQTINRLLWRVDVPPTRKEQST